MASAILLLPALVVIVMLAGVLTVADLTRLPQRLRRRITVRIGQLTVAVALCR